MTIYYDNMIFDNMIFISHSSKDKAAALAWMPMQKEKPNRIAGLLASFPR